MAVRDINDIVLVHGAFTDGSVWSEVIARLEGRGFSVISVQNPMTSHSDDVAATLRAMERVEGPVVLAGHSWGGAVITQAGLSDKVRSLVYVTAVAPDQSEPLSQLQTHAAPSPGMQRAAPDSAGFLWMDRQRYRAELAADVAEERVAVLAATQQPISLKCFEGIPSGAAWRSKPSFYVIAEDDRTLSPDLQAWMAARMGATVTRVKSSHMALIAHADTVADVIDQAAHQS